MVVEAGTNNEGASPVGQDGLAGRLRETIRGGAAWTIPGWVAVLGVFFLASWLGAFPAADGRFLAIGRVAGAVGLLAALYLVLAEIEAWVVVAIKILDDLR